MYSNLTCLLLFVLFDGDPNAEGIQKLKLVRTHWERHLLEWDHKKWEPRLPSGANIFPFLWFWSVTCPEKQLQRKLDHTVKEERVHDVAQTKGKNTQQTGDGRCFWKQQNKMENWTTEEKLMQRTEVKCTEVTGWNGQIGRIRSRSGIFKLSYQISVFRNDNKVAMRVLEPTFINNMMKLFDVWKLLHVLAFMTEFMAPSIGERNAMTWEKLLEHWLQPPCNIDNKHPKMNYLAKRGLNRLFFFFLGFWSIIRHLG